MMRKKNLKVKKNDEIKVQDEKIEKMGKKVSNYIKKGTIIAQKGIKNGTIILSNGIKKKLNKILNYKLKYEKINK